MITKEIYEWKKKQKYKLIIKNHENMLNKNFIKLSKISLIRKKTANDLKKKNFVKILGSKDCNLLKKKKLKNY